MPEAQPEARAEGAPPLLTIATRAAVFAALLMGSWSLGDSKVALAQTVTLALDVEGPDAQAVRGIVLEALPPGIELAAEKTTRAALVHEGQNRPLGRDLDPVVIDRVRRAARVMGVAAVVVVRVRRDRTARRALLLVVPARKTPASVEEVTLAFTSHDEDVAAIASALGQSLEPYAPQPTPPADAPSPVPRSSDSDLGERGTIPEPSGSQAPPTVEPPTSTRESAGSDVAEGAIRRPSAPAQLAATSVLDIAVAGEIVGRHFEYKNGIGLNDRRYTLFPAPAASLRGQLFPLARAGSPWADIGLIVEYVRMYSGLNDTNSAPADVFPSSYSAGLRARVHPGTDPPLILGLSVQYAFTSFLAVGPPAFELPDVTYRSIRSAIDSRVSFGRFSLLDQVAFRAAVDKEAISTRFYAPQGYGLDAELGAALMLVRAVEARLVVDYELYSFAFTPPAGATFGAGSARDQLYGAQLAFAFVL